MFTPSDELWRQLHEVWVCGGGRRGWGGGCRGGAKGGHALIVFYCGSLLISEVVRCPD